MQTNSNLKKTENLVSNLSKLNTFDLNLVIDFCPLILGPKIDRVDPLCAYVHSFTNFLIALQGEGKQTIRHNVCTTCSLFQVCYHHHTNFPETLGSRRKKILTSAKLHHIPSLFSLIMTILIEVRSLTPSPSLFSEIVTNQHQRSY